MFESVLQAVGSIIVFVLVFSVLVVVHEIGHFFAAKWSGVKVLEFGLGLGKKLWSRTRGETEFTINAIPFGGFVRMLGEEETSKDPRSFGQAKLWKRMWITVAGVIMNMVLAFVLLVGLFTAGTNPFVLSQAELDAAIAQGTIEMVVSDTGEKMIRFEEIQKPFFEAFPFAATETWRITKGIFVALGDLPGKAIDQKGVPDDVAGPVGMAEVIYNILPQGIKALLSIMVLLSLSLAVMNILPIPALDGGRLLFQLIELITFQKPSEKIENALHGAGFVFLLALIIIISIDDLIGIGLRIFG